jgi:hypothetical protein
MFVFKGLGETGRRSSFLRILYFMDVATMMEKLNTMWVNSKQNLAYVAHFGGKTEKQ